MAAGVYFVASEHSKQSVCNATEGKYIGFGMSAAVSTRRLRLLRRLHPLGGWRAWSSSSALLATRKASNNR